RNVKLDHIKLMHRSAGRPLNLSATKLIGGDVKTKSHLELKSDYTGKDAVIVKSNGPGDWGNNVKIIVHDAGLGEEDPDLFGLSVMHKDIVETYDNLSLLPESGDYLEKRINGISNLVSVEVQLPIRPANADVTLAGGKNGENVTASDYDGLEEDQTHKCTGLKAFDKISEISLVCAPDENRFSLKEESHESDENSPGSTDESSLKKSNVLADKLVTHCSNHKDRFAILQADEAPGAIQGIYPYVYTKYAATYYPWIRIIDPSTNMARYVPPCGHVAGIYARTDTERGVHKAPANTPVRSVVDLKFDVVDAEQEILNPRGVNCIRSFPGRGILVWGARTSSLDPSWKYVNVSRLFIFVEKSIKEGIRWAVFEPNNEKLWSRVKQTVDQFLTTVWRTGALMGTTADQAFFVRCDRTTMTQDDIDNGRLVVLVGIAPTKPAEFVIFRIAQVAKGSDISEA
ncbi:MAG: phage tail sheath subtilisin-like domain-containing protein, partial [Methanothrix sp.]|nr:phage tail sheath subtilisin-like domain-containing protein [Methanothrix sp.]